MTLLLSRSMYGGQLPTEDKDMCVVFLMNLTVPTVPTVPKVPCKRVFVCWVYVPRPRSLRDARHWQLILWPIPSNMSWSNFVYMYMSYINDSLSLFARADWHRVWKSWWRTGLTSKLLRHMLAGNIGPHMLRLRTSSCTLTKGSKNSLKVSCFVPFPKRGLWLWLGDRRT